jgi:hypothetical protein
MIVNVDECEFAEVLHYEWRTHQELNLKPSDP